ncbi:helix-turn-helix transcriptional regulator [Enterovibrio norvegicus]|uniref:helix-turn-helix transcriptional regulator n=1 Tax=Enterovibrio norvegicus TaxID=188144 RepID=UPI000C8311C8|nr:helix-turn-helix transcriptional regulator [Enterovibrio norvegicus]PMH64515.1 hypothetical protein BCU62_15790 [Enterovibrio norvegicus]
MIEKVNKKSISKKIKIARTNADKTQADMARQLEVARQTYLDLESGKTEPRVSTLCEISKITGLPLIWFCEDVQDSMDYQKAKESKDVMDLLVLLSKLPSDARVELLRVSTHLGSMMLDYTNNATINDTAA